MKDWSSTGGQDYDDDDTNSFQNSIANIKPDSLPKKQTDASEIIAAIISTIKFERFLLEAKHVDISKPT